MVAMRKGVYSVLGTCERITRLGAIQSQKTREIEVLQQKSYDVVPRSHLFFFLVQNSTDMLSSK